MPKRTSHVHAEHARKNGTSVTPAIVVHIGLSPDLSEKLDQMVKADRRKKGEWIRVLIESEWDRRQKGAQP